MNKNRIIFYIVLFLLFLLWLSNPFFVLNEGRQAIITQFGKPVREPITKAGLHFKVPFVQKVRYFEKRTLEWDGYPTQIPTRDKKYLLVDTIARWRIVDALKFYQSVHDERGAQARLDDTIDSAVRDVITSHNLIDIVRTSNRIVSELKILKAEDKFVEESALEKIETGREKITQKILEIARALTPQYGIEVIDVRIKRVNYIEEVRKKAYERMIAERKRAAEKYRSEGRGVKAEIEGKTQKELKKVLSEAYKKAQEIKGRAEAKATEIYAESFGKDPEFYSFLKTLETYRKTIDRNTFLILSTDSEIYKFLKELN
ncbi:protease modulator HflC [Candidatus Calescamantes bacterium]|nr:protease modulator HflC [Candidatus Calescamantes bacterium]